MPSYHHAVLVVRLHASKCADKRVKSVGSSDFYWNLCNFYDLKINLWLLDNLTKNCFIVSITTV